MIKIWLTVFALNVLSWSGLAIAGDTDTNFEMVKPNSDLTTFVKEVTKKYALVEFGQSS